MKSRKILSLLFFIIALSGYSQNITLTSSGSSTQCSGNFYDSGGAGTNGGAKYGNDQDFTWTICPDGTGLVSLDFTTFDMESFDYLYVYDGNSTAATSLGVYNGLVPLTGTVQATTSNPTGCLTFRFVSDGSGTYGGWVASISCVFPCQQVQAAITPSEAASSGIIKICQGESVTFNGSATYPQNGTYYTQSDATSTFDWSVTGGSVNNSPTTQNTTQTFSTAGAYHVNLVVSDVNGCESTNSQEIIVEVSTTPSFTGTVATLPTICLGETNTLTGVVTPTTYTEDCTPTGGSQVYLPDGTGTAYTNAIAVSCYASGQTITNANQIASVCMNMEHSYIGDLDITITCPTGQTVTLLDYVSGDATGGEYLGTPVDDDNTPLIAGTGANYCFTTSASQTMVEACGTVATGAMLPAGNYEPVQAYTGLVGCEINGDWTISITDNLGSDNGYIFYWSVDFANVTPTEMITFTPVVVTESWQTDATILSTSGNTITVQPTVTGTSCYTYQMTDDFGCTYTNTPTCFTVTPPTITPTFTALGPYCVCATPGTLPTTSNNGITGSWSPATISTASAGTTTYTFTPSAGQCAAIITMDVVVNPIVVTMPANGSSTVACPALAVAPTVPTVLDNCSRTLTVSAPVVSTAPTCSGTKTYTYTYTDCAGTTYPWVYTYTISAPTVTMPANGSSTVACPTLAVAPTAPTILDNCGRTLTVSAPVVTAAPTCSGTQTYTYTYTDCAGVTYPWVYTYTISVPTVTMPADDGETVACPALAVAPTTPTVLDNCGRTLSVSAAVISVAPTCSGTQTYTYTYTDCAGTTYPWVYTYTISAPTVTMPADDGSTVACPSAAVAPTAPTVSDNCGRTLTVSAAVVSAAPTCSGTQTYTYTYTDCAGTTYPWVYTYTISAPVVTMPANDGSTVVCVTDVVAPTAPTILDNCGRTLAVSAPVISAAPACSGTQTYTYTFTDCSGATYPWVYTYTINDLVPPTASNPSDLSVSGIGAVPAPDPTVVTDEADNCSTPTVAFVSDVSDEGACPEIITRTYSVTDACLNQILVTQLIYVGDPIAPTASNPTPVATDCMANVPAPNPTVVTDEADNGATPIVTWEDDVASGTCPITIARRYRVTDDCGNFIFVTQTITVQDVTAPVFAAAPIAVTVSCPADVPAMTNLGYTDNCDAAGSVAGTDVSDGATCPETITRTWTYTDVCGNTATTTQTIIVHDLIAPVFAAAPAAVTVSCSADVPAMTNLGYTDNCDAAGSVTGTDVSDGATCPETITRTWSITDACGNVATTTQTITVHDLIAPVFAAAPADVTVECIADVPVMTDLGYTDNCDAAGSVTGTDGALTGGACGGTITRTWTYTDACGNVATTTQTITVDDTTPPTASNPATTIVPGGPAPVVDPLVVTDEADNCSVPVVAFVSESTDGAACPETITRIYSVTDDCGNTINVTQLIQITDPFLPTASNPAAITVECIGDVPTPDPLVVTDEADNQGAPTVAWVSDASDGGSCPEIITRTYSVTDLCAGQILVTQTITVQDITAPVFAAAPAAVTVSCSADVPAMANLGYTDNCDAAGSVAGTDVSDGGSCPEVITRTWTYTDACGNVATATQTITIHDLIAPVFAAAPAAATVSCSADVPVMTDLGYTDNCDAAGSVTGTDVSDGATCPETITRTWSITDACGNVATATQTITVHDLIAPVFAAAPADVTVECIADVPLMIDLGYTDNCDAAGSVTGLDGALTGGACGGTITRTWTYTDACGNVATTTQTITVDDTTLPTASNPATITVPGGPAPAIDPLVVTDAADNCSVPVVAFVSESTDGAACPETITRIYSVTDDCGNTINVTHTILITDPFLPTASNPAGISVECIGDVPTPDPLVVTDEADNQGAPTVAWVSDASDGGSCPEIITRTYSVTDLCAGQILVTQTITVLDITAPTATSPATVNVECIGDVPVEDVSVITDATDNCTAVPTVAFVGDASDGNTCPETITRTYSITDDCGNSTNVTQTIIVNDVTAPVGTAPATVNVECIADVPVADISLVTGISDNCTAVPTVAFVNDASDGNTCPETITRTYSITDDCGNVTNVIQSIIVNDVTPPTASNPVTTIVPGGPAPAVDPSVVTDAADNCSTPVVAFVSESTDGAACPETITRIYSVTDACGNTMNVTHLIQITDPFLPTASNPAGITVECIGDVPAPDPLVVTDEADNQGVPTVAWVNDVSDGGSCPEIITRTYSVTDLCEGQILVTQTITVLDITAPTASSPATVNVECIGDVPVADVNVITDAADNCTAVPAVAFVSDASDGNACPETITRTYSVTDDCGNTTNVTQTIIVNDVTAPVGTAPVTVNVECIADVPASDINLVTGVSDNCTSVPTVAFVGDVSDGNTCPETITRTYSITDDCGNTTNVTHSIIVQDVTVPTASNPATTIVPGGTAPAVDPLVVTDEADNCSIPVVAFISESTDGAACPETITRIYSVTDDCGNTMNVTHLIQITDPILPTASNPTGITVECVGDVPSPDPLVVTDEADNQGVPTVAWVNDASNGGSCPEIITRTYSVTDLCDNVITVTQTITVLDITNPTASNPAPITVDCIGDVPAANPSVIIDEADNCSVPVVAFVGDVSDGNSCNGEIITRTYSVTDACGNSINVTQTILIDAVTPAFTLSSTDPTTCGGNEGTITISGLNPSEDYIITYGGVDVSSIPFDGSGNIVITGLSAGSYTNFVVKDANCVSCSMTDNSIITLVDPALPIVDAGPDQTVCDGSSVVLSGSGAVSYSWNNNVVDNVAFTPLQGTVVYTVIGTAANECQNSDQVTVTVNELPSVPVTNPVNYCLNDVAVPLTALQVLNGIGEPNTFKWYTVPTGGIGTTIAPIPSTALVGTTTYYVSQVGVITGCEGSREPLNVIIIQPTTTTFTQIEPMCEGVTAPLLPGNSTNSPAISGTWSPQTINTTTAGTVAYTFTPNAGQCASTQTMDITINPVPVLTITDPKGVCFPGKVDLTDSLVTAGSTTGNNILLTYWSSLNPLTQLSIPTSVGTSGTYFIQSSTPECSSSFQPVYVTINSLPIAAFEPNPSLVPSYYTQSTMVNNSVGAVDYLWNFGDETTSTEEMPVHDFPYDKYGDYTVTLIAISENECVDTAYATVTVKEELVYYIPNTFTPDGDGVNDYFLPVFTSGYDPYDYSLLIFNRWGQIVFESHDATRGWNGSLGADGDRVQDGSYNWKIEFKTTTNGQRKMLVGHVNILK